LDFPKITATKDVHPVGTYHLSGVIPGLHERRHHMPETLHRGILHRGTTPITQPKIDDEEEEETGEAEQEEKEEVSIP
jgi:hypothetical protein